MNNPDQILANAHQSTIEYCNSAQRELHDRVMQRMFGITPSTPVKQIGRYEVIGCLGEGMSAVHLARDPDLEQEVAIKVLHTGDDNECRSRLQAEAEAMAGLTHPNLVRVVDQGEHDGEIFVVMERVVGSSLRAWQQRAPRSRSRIIEVYCEAARGLHAAHEAGIVHRDFKPDNVFIADRGGVKVTDFGLAQVRESLRKRIAESIGPGFEDIVHDEVTQGALRSLAGTPAYMAPESVRGTPGDARSDQFSFCVSLYESLCGERPFAANTIMLLLTHIMTGTRRPRPPVALPPKLWAVIDRGLSLDPAQRFESMRELETALAGCFCPS